MNNGKRNFLLSLLSVLLVFVQCNTDKAVRHIYPINVYTKTKLNKRDVVRLREGFRYLNDRFNNSSLGFSIANIEPKKFPYIEDLKESQFDTYLELSSLYDSKDTISLWIVSNDYDRICNISNTYISCSKTGGFTFVNNVVTNNIVISKFDLSNPNIIAHEFGHFFGLYHTFEEQRFGKELPTGEVQIKNSKGNIVKTIPKNKKNCREYGDRICDTPPDPSTAFEIFISYKECEMFYKDYKPMLNNIMSYYKPCINKEYLFTQGQLDKIKEVGLKTHKNKYHLKSD